VIPWTADQLPVIARRVLEQAETAKLAGMSVDPHRVAWAESVLRTEAARPDDQCTRCGKAGHRASQCTQPVLSAQPEGLTA